MSGFHFSTVTVRRLMPGAAQCPCAVLPSPSSGNETRQRSVLVMFQNAGTGAVSKPPMFLRATMG
jgi:hypothetical protein